MRKSVLVLVCVACVVAAQLAAAQSSIDIRKQGEGADVRTLPPGDVSFDIVVTNDGDAPLTDVAVTDALVPDCDQVIGDLAVAGGFAYTCTAPSVSIGFVNEACVVGTDPNGQCTCPRTPGYWKNHKPQWPVNELVIGGVLYGKGALHRFLVYPDEDDSDASLKLARHLTATMLNLAAGSDPSIQPVVDQANAYLAAIPPGSDPQGADKVLALDLKDQLDAYNNAFDCDAGPTVPCAITVTDCDPSEVVIVAADPMIDIRKQEEGPDIRARDPFSPVDWVIEVTNTGDVPLANVTVSDLREPNCDLFIGALGIGDSVLYTCTTAAGWTDFENEACVSGDGAGTTVGDCDPSTIQGLR